MITARDLQHLRRCVELAEQALREGDEPFGSVLVGADGRVLAEDHNRVSSGDRTRHPEFELARWAAGNLTPAERAAATVYTSGEHCPMCSAAHAWVGLGRIVYLYSAEQYRALGKQLGMDESPVAGIPAGTLAPTVIVEGPEPALAPGIEALHRRYAELLKSR